MLYKLAHYTHTCGCKHHVFCKLRADCDVLAFSFAVDLIADVLCVYICVLCLHCVHCLHLCALFTLCTLFTLCDITLYHTCGNNLTCYIDTLLSEPISSYNTLNRPINATNDPE